MIWLKFLHLLIVPILVVVAPVHHHPVHHPYVQPKVTLHCRALEQLWIRNGGAPWAARQAASVAEGESRGQWWPEDRDKNGSVDRGLWQINSLWGSRLSTLNNDANARAAIVISHNGTDWWPWISFDEHRDTSCGT